VNHQLVKGAAKAGYASRGVVYLLVGGLALAAAVGWGGEAEDTKGALLKVFETGFGSILLLLIAVGLLFYAAWRLIQAIADCDDHGTDPKGLTIRAALLVSALSHSALSYWAFYAALSGAGGGGEGKQGFVAWLLHQPFGPWLVGIVGICIIGAGAAHIAKGATRGFEKWFDADERALKMIRPISMTGLIARGVVFLVVGGLFIYAGVTVDPDKAGGVRDALIWLRGQPFGTLLFATIAFGLVCFGLYSLLEAFYRRITAAKNHATGGGAVSKVLAPD
jgi:hypothetical protein